MRAPARVHHETCEILCVPQRVHTHSCGRVRSAPQPTMELVRYTTLAAVDHCGFRKPAAQELRRITLENATTQNQTRPVQDGSKPAALE